MGREPSYRRAESMYSPRVEGDDPDEEPPEEFTFDLEDDLAGLNDGNGFGPSRKSRIIRICVWTLIVSVVCLGVAAAIVFTVRSRGEGVRMCAMEMIKWLFLIRILLSLGFG